MANWKRFVLPAAALIFSILALIFSLLTITSREWAVQQVHDDLVHPWEWTKANTLYSIYRSPFSVCTAREVQANPDAPDNTISTSNATPSTSSATPTPIWTVHCDKYKPFGRNASSCEALNVTGSDVSENRGDARLCQQIHYAGNFGIASTFFVGMGFILTCVMVVFTATHRLRAPVPETVQQLSASEHEGEGAKAEAQSQARTWANKDSATWNTPVLPLYVNLVLVVFLFVAFATGIISQFYGIMAFIQSYRGQSDYSSTLGPSNISQTPWYQGKALSVYATVAWGFVVATGTASAMAWRFPSLEA